MAQPTQFYHIPADQGMTTRSGKIINSVTNTTFIKDCETFVDLYNYMRLLFNYFNTQCVHSRRVFVVELQGDNILDNYLTHIRPNKRIRANPDGMYHRVKPQPPQYMSRVLVSRNKCVVCMTIDLILSIIENYNADIRSIFESSSEMTDLKKKFQTAFRDYSESLCKCAHYKTKGLNIREIDFQDRYDKVQQALKFISSPSLERQETYFILASTLPAVTAKNILDFL